MEVISKKLLSECMIYTWAISWERHLEIQDLQTNPKRILVVQGFRLLKRLLEG